MPKCFQILRIEPTKDKRQIKRAYAKLLPEYRPEVDNEGFMRLREAYEEALALADQEDEKETEKDPVALWIDKVDQIYQNYETRIDVSKWQELLEEDVCFAIDSANACNEQLLIYLAEHIMVPHEVLHVLEEYFHWETKKQQLLNLFPENYIEYLLSNAKYPDNFRYLLLKAEEPMDYDACLEEYYKLDHLMNEGEKEEIEKSLARLSKYPVRQPDIEELKLRTLVYLERKEEAEAVFQTYREAEPDKERFVQVKARYYLEVERYDEAEKAYQEILDKTKDHVGAMIGLAAVFQRRNDLEKALEIIEKAQELVPYNGYVRNFCAALNEEIKESRKEAYEQNKEDPEKVYQYCKTLADSCHYEEAEEIFEALTENYPDETRYLELKSSVYIDLIDLNRKSYEKAIPALERLVELHPEKLAYYEDLGYCYGEADQLEQAKEVYAKAKEIDETSPRIYYRLAQIYLKEKRYQDAVDICDVGLQYDNQIPNLYHFKAEAYYRMGEYEKALELCDRAISILPYMDTFEIKAKIFAEYDAYEELEQMLAPMSYPDSMTDLLLSYLAQAKRNLDKREEAQALLEQAITNHSKEGRIYYQRGVLCYTEEEGDRKKQLTQAVALAQKAAELNVDYKYEYLLLEVQALRALNDSDAAKERMEEWLRKGIREARLYLLYADVEHDLDHRDEALQYYQKAAELNPDHPGIHGRICDIYMEQGCYEEALKEVTLQLALAPSDYYYVDQGIIYNELDRNNEAKKSYEMALEDNPENCYAWANLGFLAKETGHLEEALLDYEKALANEHPNLRIVYEAARLSRRLNKIEQAVSYLLQIKDQSTSYYYEARLMLADIYAEQGKRKQSALIYQELLQPAYQDDYTKTITHYANLFKHAGEEKAMISVWKRALKRSQRMAYRKAYGNHYECQYYKYLGGYYLDYKNDLKKACKYYEKAYQLNREDGYVCSKLGVLYEKLGDLNRGAVLYEAAFREDIKLLKQDSKDACAADCVGMDYAWKGMYEESIRMFFWAVYYGPRCAYCTKCCCYEVYYDMAEMYERRAKEVQPASTELLEFVRLRKEELEKAEEKIQEDVELPEQSLFASLVELLDDYVAVETKGDCLKMAKKYYEEAYRRCPHKEKYKKAVKRFQ